MRSILDMNHKAAKRFFFRPRSYFSLALPSYYQFDKILTKSRDLLRGQNLRDFYIQSAHPQTFSDINYSIIYNKDGEYSWRRYQLIHPFFYTEMVHLLTEEETWNYVRKHVRSFRNPKITCTSMVLAPTSRLTKNEQDIFNWAGNFVSETVRKSLEYKYLLTTDMANCYDSLTTDLLIWALHGCDSPSPYSRASPYAHDPDQPTIGYQLAALLQDMLYGHTCGLPQGSVLMDFLAEIILSYIDTILFERLVDFSDIHILRYRDDYRIFANEITTARQVMKILVETLAEFNLKINLSKTFLTADVITHAFKPDRTAWKKLEPRIIGENKLSTLKSLFLIRDFGREFPNCGSIKAGLATLYEREIYESGCHDDLWQIVGVLADIMYTHPGVWPHCVAILSRYLEAHNPAVAISIVEHLRKKFSDLPHTEYLNIWLQRLSVKIDPYYNYGGRFCCLLHEPNVPIWNSDWLGMYTSLCDADIVSYDEILAMPHSVPTEEVAFFITNHGSGG